MNLRAILARSLLMLPLSAFAALRPYVCSLEDADGIAIVRVIACEQRFDGRFIRSHATLAVEIAIVGVKKGETFRQSFGLPQEPGTWKNGSYSQKLLLASEGFSFDIAERYLVLLKQTREGWVVSRDSTINDDMIYDGYFDAFADAHEVSVSKAIELLKAFRKSQKPNQAAEPTRTAVTPPADAGDRASGARGSP
ncbi:MAG: hypothetical protein PHE83_08135 [Opitutaceae bacterium]|nr:hypothetical protein [Opitutaceae bacterium]